MPPVLSNRDVLMVVILTCGFIVASVLAVHSQLEAPLADIAAMEPSTLGGGSAAADVQSVAYLEGGEELVTVRCDSERHQ